MIRIKKGKIKHLLTTMVAFSFILAACGSAEQVEDSEPGTINNRDELIVGFPGNPAQIDLHAANDVPSRQIFSHVFETLVIQDENQNILPGLATSWNRISDNVWQFTIREGVIFHNGEPLTAYDVAFSIKRVAASPILSPIFGMFDADLIEVVDDYTINIGTTDPFGPTLAHLAHQSAAILSEDAVGDTSIHDTTLEQLIGTGPYTVVELNFDEYIILERFDDFHGDRPNIRQITFRIMTDPNARTFALEVGDVDVILNIAPSDVANLTADPSIHVQSVASPGIEFMGMNFNHPYLGIREVRQAINYALNTEEIVEVSTEGTAEPLTTFVAPSVFGFSPDADTYEFNLERAQELMDEAGVDGFDMDIIINSGSAPRLMAAEIIQNQLQAIGISVSIYQLEWATYLAVRDDNDFDAYIGGWSNPAGDADNGLVSILHSEAADIQMNSDELDALLMAGRRSIDEAERLEIYREVLQYLHDAAPFVLLGNTIHFVATGENVRGITSMPTNVQFFGSAYFVD